MDAESTAKQDDFTDWLRIYEQAADIISDFLAELGQRPQQADHNARAILARLARAEITVAMNR